MLLYIPLFCSIISVGFAEELPAFIKKCSLTDPNLLKCFVRNGNLAIPELVKGSSFFGTPPARPLHISEIDLPGVDFTVLDLCIFQKLTFLELILQIAHVRLEGVHNGTALLTAPYLNLTADYIIVSNDYFFPTVVENGRLHTTLVDNLLKYHGMANRLSRNGELYLKFARDDSTFQTKRIFYRYSDIHDSRIGNFQEFLNVHKQIIDKGIIPGVNKVLHDFLRTVSVNLLKNIFFSGVQCSLTDPDVSNCVIRNGNLAIPELLKGSSFFGVPTAIPLRTSPIYLPGSDFTVSLSHIRLFGLENFRVVDVRVYEINNGGISLTAPYLNLTADYKIFSNDLFFPRIVENGKLDATLVPTCFS
ncbi:hemolymph juvenile hormone binding protein (JHBP) [Popillia japonica]|uniref:Hemolymph juvenile hormone binding protein (JHBP) n=1 Tax=Popillia japonica TaxID=7064 RepID=A0AAW1NBT3_POPJA